MSKIDSRQMMIGGVVLTALLGAWVTGTLQTGDDVLILKPQVEQNTARIEAAEQWQSDWERSGELPADIRQDLRIEDIKEEIDALEARVETLDKAVRELELQEAAE